MRLEFQPLTPSRRDDLEQLFGSKRRLCRLLVHVVAVAWPGILAQSRCRHQCGPQANHQTPSSRDPGLSQPHPHRLVLSRTASGFHASSLAMDAIPPRSGGAQRRDARGLGYCLLFRGSRLQGQAGRGPAAAGGGALCCAARCGDRGGVSRGCCRPERNRPVCLHRHRHDVSAGGIPGGRPCLPRSSDYAAPPFSWSSCNRVTGAPGVETAKSCEPRSRFSASAGIPRDGQRQATMTSSL